MTIKDLSNLSLKRAGVIRSDITFATTLTQAEHQHDIDVMLQCINEVLAELTFYGVIDFKLVSGTITMVAGTDTYELNKTFTGFHSDYMYDLTNNYYITRYQGSAKDWQKYKDFVGQTAQQGQPLWFYESSSGNSSGGDSHNWVEVYPIPDAQADGYVYTFYYREGVIPNDNAGNEPAYTSTTTASTPLPVTDMVAHMLVPAIAELWRFYRTETFQPAIYSRSMSVATRAMMPQDHALSY